MIGADIERALANFRGRRVLGAARMQQASVAIVFRDPPSRGGGAELLFIKRAHRAGDPWSGNMAFPGGKVQPPDPSPLAAAIRETSEEIGVDLAQDAVHVNQLSQILALTHNGRRPMVITPFVFRAVNPLALRPATAEVAEAIWIPLSFFADRGNRSRYERKVLGLPWRFRAYEYQGRVVWGLSLRMLNELVRRVTAH